MPPISMVLTGLIAAVVGYLAVTGRDQPTTTDAAPAVAAAR